MFACIRHQFIFYIEIVRQQSISETIFVDSFFLSFNGMALVMTYIDIVSKMFENSLSVMEGLVIS